AVSFLRNCHPAHQAKGHGGHRDSLDFWAADVAFGSTPDSCTAAKKRAWVARTRRNFKDPAPKILARFHEDLPFCRRDSTLSEKALDSRILFEYSSIERSIIIHSFIEISSIERQNNARAPRPRHRPQSYGH